MTMSTTNDSSPCLLYAKLAGPITALESLEALDGDPGRSGAELQQPRLPCKPSWFSRQVL